MTGSASKMRPFGPASRPYARNVPVAVATELAIRVEAMLRPALVLPLNVGTAMVGRETPELRRHHRELAESARLRDTFETRPSTPRPVVNWHEGGQGPALLLLNGFTASGLVWPESWLRHLEEHHRVIRIDNRGTGWSRTAPHPFTIGDLAEDARNVLRSCGIEHATVLGLSMGGMIAQELAIRHPRYVDKLVLVATLPPTPAQIPLDQDAYRLLTQTPPPGADLRQFLVAAWARTVSDEFAAAHPEMLTELVDQVMRRVTPRATVANQARAILAWYGASRLRPLRMPTTVVHGDRDPLAPVGNGARLVRLIPDATYIELPGVGHLVPHEAGAALLRVLDG